MAMASGQFRIDEVITLLEQVKEEGFSIIDLSIDDDDEQHIYIHGAGISRGGDMLTGIGFDAPGLAAGDIIEEAWTEAELTEYGSQYIERRKREMLSDLWE